jgi:hypothetical protein
MDIPPIPGTGGASAGDGSFTAAPTKTSAAAVEGSTCHCDPLPYLSSLSRVSVSAVARLNPPHGR